MLNFLTLGPHWMQCVPPRDAGIAHTGVNSAWIQHLVEPFTSMKAIL